jgi:hypothetical protein
VYVPGIRSVIVYVPELLLTLWLATAVASFVTVIFASGTTAPLASVTVPVMELRACPCSLAGDTARTQRARQIMNKRQATVWKLRDCEMVENILICELLRSKIGSLSKNTLSILLVMYYDYAFSPL